MATAESSPAPAVNDESIVLDAHRGSRNIAVTLRYSAVREIRALLTRPDPEMAGVLCGRWHGDAVTIEHADGSTGAGAVGLFRAQPGGWTALTPADRKKFHTLGLARGLLVVVRTLAQRPWSATLFLIEPEGAGLEAPVAEFPWDEYLLRNGWLLDLAPPVPPQPRPAPPPRSRRGRNWLAAAVLLLIAGAGGAAAYRWLPVLLNRPPAEASVPPAAPAAPPSPALALNVEHQGEDLAVSWNRLADAVRQARAATLTIRSGVATRVIEMQPDQLREGRVVFHPLTGVDTDVRLEVLDAGGKPEAESVQVLGFDTAPAVTLPAPAPPKAAPARTGRTQPPQQSADRDEAELAGGRKPAVIAPAPGRNEAVPIRRANPEVTRDVINEMRAAKGKVTVSVLISIDATGRVDDAKVVASTGEPNPSGPYIRFASLTAARQWRFRPATSDGKPVSSQMTLLFTF